MNERHAFRHNAAEMRYELDVENERAVVEYIRDGRTLFLTHTGVPPTLEGRGIGSELVRAVLEDVRRQELRIVPQCPFVAAYIRRHPEWEPLLADKQG
ncbi:GNAT family N-acetyltransferase [Alistipes sp.]|uniref:GNAT family N-acetyltransferase n=1 Tax=Alistipes sp. TaxID=1872444 RepID=UPI003AF1CD56